MHVRVVRSSLKRPCGSHAGCERLMGAYVMAQLPHLDSAKLYTLGIKSAVDLLVYTAFFRQAQLHTPAKEFEPRAVEVGVDSANNGAAVGPGKDGEHIPSTDAHSTSHSYSYSYVTLEAGTFAMQDQWQSDFQQLFAALKPLPRKKIKSILSAKCTGVGSSVLAAIFDELYDNVELDKHDEPDPTAATQAPADTAPARVATWTQPIRKVFAAMYAAFGGADNSDAADEVHVPPQKKVAAADFWTLPTKQWATRKHIPAAAVAELVDLGAHDVSDFPFLEGDDLQRIARKLLKSGRSPFLDAWWFEHGMAHTLGSLRNRVETADEHAHKHTSATDQHGIDEL